MKYLIVGLGNIGADYHRTRHNIGFMTLDSLAASQSFAFEFDKLATVASFKYRSRAVHLIKPTTYMNLSGKAVNYWMKTLKIPKENTLVIVDDIALPFGSLRMRAKGSAAGHNGLKSIEELTGGTDYPRLKFGIGNNFHNGRQVEYVLSEFSPDEQTELPMIIDKAIDMILGFCSIGIQQTMNKFND